MSGCWVQDIVLGQTHGAQRARTAIADRAGCIIQSLSKPGGPMSPGENIVMTLTLHTKFLIPVWRAGGEDKSYLMKEEYNILLPAMLAFMRHRGDIVYVENRVVIQMIRSGCARSERSKLYVNCVLQFLPDIPASPEEHR